MFKFLRAAPCVEEIQDSKLVAKKYKYWRLRVFWGCILDMRFTISRAKALPLRCRPTKSELGLENWELGLLGSILSISYGASKFVSGIIGDRSNPRYFMAIGLILTGIFNIFLASPPFFGYLPFLGPKRLVSGMGMARLCEIIDALVFTVETMVEYLEYLP